MKPIRERTYKIGRKDMDDAIENLVHKTKGTEDHDIITDMVVTALKLAEDEIERGDLKMMNAAMKELRYALKVFYPFRHVRKVAIFGSARTPRTAADYIQARDFAKAIVREGWMVITGASAGIMNAGNEGAGRTNSFGVNIRLPFEQDANPVIANDPKLINFKYFFTRKLIFVRESDAMVLCPGGFGTHDEGFETLTLIQTGKTSPRPVICLDPPGSDYWHSWGQFIKKEMVRRKMVDEHDLSLFHLTHDVRDAVKAITDFYKNYHSMRYIADKLILRIKKPLTPQQLDKLNGDFKDIIKKGKIAQFTKPFPEEINEPYTPVDLIRLSFAFNRRHFSRLRHLIDQVNKA